MRRPRNPRRTWLRVCCVIGLVSLALWISSGWWWARFAIRPGNIRYFVSIRAGAFFIGYVSPVYGARLQADRLPHKFERIYDGPTYIADFRRIEVTNVSEVTKMIVVPLWAPFWTSAAGVALLLFLRSRQRPHRCGTCGYDLSGVPIEQRTCPECGDLDSRTSRGCGRGWSLRWVLACVIALLPVLWLMSRWITPWALLPLGPKHTVFSLERGSARVDTMSPFEPVRAFGHPPGIIDVGIDSVRPGVPRLAAKDPSRKSAEKAETWSVPLWIPWVIAVGAAVWERRRRRARKRIEVTVLA